MHISSLSKLFVCGAKNNTEVQHSLQELYYDYASSEWEGWIREPNDMGCGNNIYIQAALIQVNSKELSAIQMSWT